LDRVSGDLGIAADCEGHPRHRRVVLRDEGGERRLVARGGQADGQVERRSGRRGDVGHDLVSW
jgi:hypothetical protein